MLIKMVVRSTQTSKMDEAIARLVRELYLEDIEEAEGRGGIKETKDERSDADKDVCSLHKPVVRPKDSGSASASARPSSPSSDLLRDEILEEICVGCKDDYHLHDVLQTPCGHFFCQSCLHRLAEAASRDESLYPPSCCRQTIPLSSSSFFLEKDLIEVLESKAEEHRTANRIYCRDAACSEFIPSEHARSRVATCPKCGKETCSICKGQPHGNSDCPEDPAEKELDDLAKGQKWARCPNCRRRIEIAGGCNHMRYGIIVPVPFHAISS